MFWLPNWLYESMPYVYLGSGLIIINLNLHAVGEISGVLLCFVGAFIILMRRNARAA